MAWFLLSFEHDMTKLSSSSSWLVFFFVYFFVILITQLINRLVMELLNIWSPTIIFHIFCVHRFRRSIIYNLVSNISLSLCGSFIVTNPSPWSSDWIPLLRGSSHSTLAWRKSCQTTPIPIYETQVPLSLSTTFSLLRK